MKVAKLTDLVLTEARNRAQCFIELYRDNPSAHDRDRDRDADDCHQTMTIWVSVRYHGSTVC